MIDDTLKFITGALSLNFSINPDPKGRFEFKNSSCRIVWRSNIWIVIDINGDKLEFNSLQDALIYAAE